MVKVATTATTVRKAKNPAIIPPIEDLEIGGREEGDGGASEWVDEGVGEAFELLGELDNVEVVIEAFELLGELDNVEVVIEAFELLGELDNVDVVIEAVVEAD